MSDENVPTPDPITTSEPAGAAPAPAPPPVYEPVPPRTRRSPAILWGALLVLGGVVLLVSQFAPGLDLWRYWPLIIIAFGIRAMFGPADGRWTIRHLGEGLSTIAFGLVFLGQMTGYLNWDVWLNILRLWPLLLVSLGLEIVGKGLKSEWVRALSSVVIIGGLAYGALVMTTTGGWPFTLLPASETKTFDMATDRSSSVKEGAAQIEGGVGSLTLKAGDRLASADGRSPFEPVYEVDSGGKTAEVQIGLGSHSWGPTTDSALNVTLSRNVIWDLQVSAGVTQYDVDLSDMMLSGLEFDAGVSDGTVTLGESDAADASGPIPVRIESGVSALRLRVPEGDDVRLDISQGLTSVNTRGDWRRTADAGDNAVYESRGFSDTGAYWDVEIQAGIGGITVEYY